MLAVNDLFVLSSPSVRSFFLEDVQAWLDLSEVRYSPHVKFTGKTGFDHQFDFLIQKSNAYAERFVRSIKEECLSRVVPLGERHLRWLVTEYVEHYRLERNHQGLGNELIDPPEQAGRGPVACRERLGGLLRYYHRMAA